MPILHPEIHPVPGFTGREDLLDAINRALWQKGGAAALTNAQSAAVHGLGGIGKSVLAQEYAWRNRARYRGVWWLRAETEQTLIDDLIALGSRLIPGLEETPGRDRATRLALDAVEQTGADTPWLLVYDNAEKPGALGILTPRTGAHRLITSPWPGWRGHAETLAVDVFPPEIAIEFLMAGAAHPDRAAAACLAEALGWLPLALAHARAYCAASNLPFDRYRARIAERIKELPDGSDYPASVFATFSLAMDKAAATCLKAETLMGIAAFLAPDRIPLDLITADVIGEDALNKAVTALYNVSLITHETLEDGSRGMSVHRLVQEVTRGRLADRKADTMLASLHLIDAALDAAQIREHTEWPRVKRHLPHAISILNAALHSGEASEVSAAVCAKLGIYFQALGEYSNGVSYLERALKLHEKVFGPDHIYVSSDLHNLATLFQQQGKFKEGEFLQMRALNIIEKALGANHIDVGICLNNLAEFLRTQGRYEEAEPLIKRAIAIQEAEPGANQLTTAQYFGNLALLYRTQGHYQDAEPLYKRALAIREEVLGPEHPALGMILHNIAQLYCAQDRFIEAEPLLRRALAIWEAAIGSDHPNVGIGLSSLAGVCESLRHYQEAEQLYRKAMTVLVKALGPDHPQVALTLNDLAFLYCSQKRYQEAEPLYKLALAIREKAFGLAHPDVGQGLNNLANLYINQGRDNEAEPHLRRAVEIYEKAFEAFHPEVGLGLHNLASLYGLQERYEEAEPLLRRALEILEMSLGPVHTKTKIAKASYEALAMLRKRRGQ